IDIALHELVDALQAFRRKADVLGLSARHACRGQRQGQQDEGDTTGREGDTHGRSFQRLGGRASYDALPVARKDTKPERRSWVWNCSGRSGAESLLTSCQ